MDFVSVSGMQLSNFILSGNRPTMAPIILTLILLSACGSGGSGATTAPPPETKWKRNTSNPLVIPKLTSTTIDISATDPSILFDPEDNKWKIWYASALKDLSSLAETMTIKYSESADGVNWTDGQIAFQVASSTTAWDYTTTETPMVIINPDPAAPASKKFIMWYAGGNSIMDASLGRPTSFPYYQIGLAYSTDGKQFTRYTPGLDGQPGLAMAADAALFGASLPGTFGDGLIADPEVIYNSNDMMFHMWFSSYAETVANPPTPGERSQLAFGVAHAVSADGISWTFPHDNPLPSLRKPGELGSGQQPSVIYNSVTNQYDMWLTNDTLEQSQAVPCNAFQANGFWHAVSSDGVSWTPDYIQQDFTWQPTNAYESLGLLTGVDVIKVNGTLHAFYAAWGNEQIPDPTIYVCPDQAGNLIPAIITINSAVFVTP